MKAVLLAGGQGMRLRPLTARIPKPLMPLGDYTVIELLLHQFARAGVDELLMCVCHQAAVIQARIGSGERYGLRVTYRHEETPLGTVGPIRACLPDLPERFLVANGDILCDLDFADLFQTSIDSKAPLTIAACERRMSMDFGVLTIDPEGQVRDFREKPTCSFWVNMGAYVMTREVLQYVPEGEAFGFDDLLHVLLEARVPVTTYPFHGHWLDIGRGEDFARAQTEFDRYQERYLPK